MTPEVEGREAAKRGLPFDKCPYTYANCKTDTVDQYLKAGYGRFRDQWFSGWDIERRRAEISERRKNLQALNVSSTSD